MSLEQQSYERAMLEKAYVRIVPPLNLRGVSTSLLSSKEEKSQINYKDESSSRMMEHQDQNVAYAIGPEIPYMH